MRRAVAALANRPPRMLRKTATLIINTLEKGFGQGLAHNFYAFKPLPDHTVVPHQCAYKRFFSDSCASQTVEKPKDAVADIGSVDTARSSVTCSTADAAVAVRTTPRIAAGLRGFRSALSIAMDLIKRTPLVITYTTYVKCQTPSHTLYIQ